MRRTVDLDTLDSGSKLSVFGHTRSRPKDNKNSLSSPHRHNLHKPDCFFRLNDSSHVSNGRTDNMTLWSAFTNENGLKVLGRAKTVCFLSAMFAQISLSPSVSQRHSALSIVSAALPNSISILSTHFLFSAFLDKLKSFTAILISRLTAWLYGFSFLFKR